ncbi:MAG: carbohydrate kinase family protein [Candidatus Levyibacteriota bacterium]
MARTEGLLRPPPITEASRFQKSPLANVIDINQARSSTQSNKTQQHEKPREGVFIIGKTTIDTNALVPSGTDVPKDMKGYGSEKYPLQGEKFTVFKKLLESAKAKFSETVGGNALNIAHWMRNLRNPKSGDIIVHTWSNPEHDELLKKDLTRPGMKPHLQVSDHEMQTAIVVPRLIDGKPNRTIFSYIPEKMPSDFAEDIPDDPKPEYAIVNSLGGSDWHKSLNAGINRLQEKDIPYVYTPGSLQLIAISEGTVSEKEAVFNAIQHAHALVLNTDELKTILKGLNIPPETEITALLQQGLDLGPQHLIVTDGPSGAYGANKDTMMHVGIIPAEVKSTLGAGDAFNGAAVHRLFETDGDIEQSLLWGTASGAFAVEQIGAHENTPSRNALETRLQETAPVVTILKPSQRKENTVFYGSRLQGPVLLAS